MNIEQVGKVEIIPLQEMELISSFLWNEKKTYNHQLKNQALIYNIKSNKIRNFWG